MKALKKILLIIGIIIVVILIGGIIFINIISKKALPDYHSTVKIESVSEEVTIYRDKYAIPHIIAKNEKDLYIAVGYVLAQDRLWQMDLLRRATQGRLSEIFGDDMVEVDLMLRSLQISKKSNLVLDSCNAEVIAALEAFSIGVNEFINTHQKKLSIEFTVLGYKPEPWTPQNSLNLIGYMAWDLKSGWVAEIALHEIKKLVDSAKFNLLIPDLKKQTSTIYPDFEISSNTVKTVLHMRDEMEKLEDIGLNIFCGSNNWAVSGEKSATGKPVLANDMHLGLFAPGIWFQMHQVIEGKLDVTGVILPGQPFIISGHNDSIAWGMTNVMLDDIDFYAETLNEDSTKYKVDGKWKDLIIMDEVVKSKSGKEFKDKLKFTHRGPIITNFKDVTNDAISMSWVGNYYSNEVQSVYYLNRAGNWNRFKDVMQTFLSTSQNVVYADIEGNIGLYCCAGIPIRRGDGALIKPGDTSLYDWTGFVPFEEKPHIYNPEEGYAISANNNTAPENYPYYISHWFHLPARYDRIKEMIEAEDKLTIEDHKNIQTDLYGLYAKNVQSKLIEPLNKLENLSEKESKAIAILNVWDFIYSKESIAPTLFEKLYYIFFKNVVIDEIGEDLYKEMLKEKSLAWDATDNFLDHKSSAWFDDVTTNDRAETFMDILELSFKETIEELEKKYGNDMDDWKWAKIHQLSLKHPMGSVNILNKIFKLNTKYYPVGGSYHTVCPYSFKIGGDDFDVVHGASERHVYSVGNWDNSFTVIPTGNSGIPASINYCDQTEMYVNNEYHKDYISIDKIKENAVYIMKITGKSE